MGSDLASADDLLVFLEVARSGRFTTAADALGINHTTVSRRVAALEKRLGGRVLARAAGGWELTPLGREAMQAAERLDAVLRELATEPGSSHVLDDVVRLSATDGFSAYIAAPAAARLRRRHAGLALEIVATTRRAMQHRSGLDIEIVVGEPQVHRAEAVRLSPYVLGLYASRDYLDAHPAPTSVGEVEQHGLVYFIDSMLQVDGLDVAREFLPSMREAVTSTNVFVHVEATRAGAGLGLLPCFMADRHDDLVRLLPGEVEVSLAYWLVTRPEASRRPAVAAVAAELHLAVRTMQDELMGRTAGTTTPGP
ncbi:LysR family transcriptional regulator [Aeromicrobium sp.]|uniref:LysR family transcriptional regulator n=1 Tax=Aeromicrobium sp. TaxID=1871063 RepID=UPI0025C1A91E|nr:LysR family transcriptional regulator [Aeromicrobium sp.]